MEFESLKRLFRLFNRKERYHLIRAACKQDFGLNPHFTEQLNRKGIAIEADSAWVAMDYHLDWISAIFRLLENDSLLAEVVAAGPLDAVREHIKAFQDSNSLRSDTPESWVLEGNQQDVDLIILAKGKDDNEIHLVLVEAKFDSPWSGKQLTTKGKRISALFPDKAGSSHPGYVDVGGTRIRVHWLFAGLAARDNGIKKLLKDFPDWIKGDPQDNYIQYAPEGCWDDPEKSLPMLLRPKRTDSQGIPGSKNKSYRSWGIDLAWRRTRNDGT